MAETAENLFTKGIEAFQWQDTDEAIEFFLQAAKMDPLSPEYPFYAALCYSQSGEYEAAESSYAQSLSLGGNQDTILLRRGNLRWTMGNIEGALEDYTHVIDSDGASSSAALLNRANLELNQGMYTDVLRDYALYLEKQPRAPDRANIQKIMALLKADLNAERIVKAKKLAEEARRAEEEAKRQKLMDQVLESLRNSGEDTKSIRAGSEDMMEEFEDSILED